MKRLATALALLMFVLVATAAVAAGGANRAGNQAVRGKGLGVAKALGLTKDQKQSIGAILKQYRADVRGVLKSGIAKEEKKTKVEALKSKAGADVEAVLTPAQVQTAKDKNLIQRLLRFTTRRGARIHWILKQLNLDQGQQDQIKKIREDSKPLAQAIKNDTTLTPEARHAKMADLRKDTIEKIKAVLTPAQQQKLQELMKNRRAGGMNRGRHGAAAN
jgi:Spy/CpxP family protein refolding chaperone